MEKLNIYQKLLKIQISVMGLKKDKKGDSYEYVTGTKVLEHIKPFMNEYGLLLKQEVLSIDNERMDYKTGIGTAYEKPKSEILSKVMMRFTWIDVDSQDTDVNLFGANGQNAWEKGLGSALTYGERYFLLKYFHIATDEDDIDNPDRKPEVVQKDLPTPQNMTAEVQTILDEINTKTTIETLGTYYKTLSKDQQQAKVIAQAATKRKLELTT